MDRPNVKQQQTVLIPIPIDEWNEINRKINEILLHVKNTVLNNKLTDNDYMTVKQVLQVCHISRATFEKLKREGKIKIYKIRGKVLVKQSELDSFIIEV